MNIFLHILPYLTIFSSTTCPTTTMLLIGPFRKLAVKNVLLDRPDPSVENPKYSLKRSRCQGFISSRRFHIDIINKDS